MRRKEESIQYFTNGLNCSQAVFTVFAKDMGLTEEQGLKIACAFGGGIARNQFTCGAVTGALMALGMLYGKGLNDNSEGKEITYGKANEFIREFTRRHGTTECKALLQGLNMNDPTDRQKIDEMGLFKTNCARYVGDAAEIVEAIARAGADITSRP